MLGALFSFSWTLRHRFIFARSKPVLCTPGVTRSYFDNHDYASPASQVRSNGTNVCEKEERHGFDDEHDEEHDDEIESSHHHFHHHVHHVHFCRLPMAYLGIVIIQLASLRFFELER